MCADAYKNPGAATSATLSLDEPNKDCDLPLIAAASHPFSTLPPGFWFAVTSSSVLAVGRHCFLPISVCFYFPIRVFFSFHPQVFHACNTYCSISSPLTILRSSPVFCCDTLLHRTRKGARPPSPQFIFPALLCLLCLKLLLPLLELLEHCILCRLWSDF